MVSSPTLRTARDRRSLLHDLTHEPFSPKAKRSYPFDMGSIATCEPCNLSCVMCHFNGPHAKINDRILDPALVRKALRDVPKGELAWFGGTGEFLLDPHALDYLRYARDLGLQPCILSHGQLFTPELLDEILKAGVRLIRMSVDSTDPVEYAKIRRGGELSRILEACDYLRSKKADYPGLRVEIGCTLFRKTFDRQDEMVEFWRGKVDAVHFNAEYYDTWKYRNIFYTPEKRVDCALQTYVLPSGYISPCCAVTVHQHQEDLTCLPHISDTSLPEAYDRLCDLYDDPQSPLAELCRGCDWWIMFDQRCGESPYLRMCKVSSPQEPQRLSPQEPQRLSWREQIRGLRSRLRRSA